MATIDPRKLAAMSAEERAKKLADGRRGREEALARRGRRARQRRPRRLPDHRQGLRRHRAARSTTRRSPRPTAASTSAARPRSRSGTPPSRGDSQDSGPTRARAGSGTTARAPRARTRWSWPTSRSASGTRFRIIQVGARTTVYLNDKLVVDHASLENYWDRSHAAPAKGPIQLQTHGGEIRWRNIYVREIPADEANAILAKHGAEGFTPIFNGQDLDGWAGPVENYEVDGRRRSAASRARAA